MCGGGYKAPLTFTKVLSGIKSHTCEDWQKCVDCKKNKKQKKSKNDPKVPVVCGGLFTQPTTLRTPHHTLLSAVQILGVERLDGKHHYVILAAASLTGHTVVLCVQETEKQEGCCI